MSVEILNENLEETTTETPVDEVVETPAVDETAVEGNVGDENIPEEVPEVELPPQRVNPFCVVSKNTFGKYNVRDIQTNGSWCKNPYGDDYAVVPDDMVPAIQETRGFCEIELNEDGTEVVSFTANEIPEIPVPTPEPTDRERIVALEEALIETEQALTDLDLQDIETQQALTDMDLRLMAVEG